MKRYLLLSLLLVLPAAAQEQSNPAWVEIFKTLSHPRCASCHTADQRPRWYDEVTKKYDVHGMNVHRGRDGTNFGNVGMKCSTCHQAQNAAVSGGPPGAPNWHLAPVEMAWFEKTSAEVCAQFKDISRNGNRDFEALREHVLKDPLVAWGWAPGGDREAAPGSAQSLADAIKKWEVAGAPCQ
jgi:mono/diheme cytochrome c family protein